VRTLIASANVERRTPADQTTKPVAAKMIRFNMGGNVPKPSPA